MAVLPVHSDMWEKQACPLTFFLGWGSWKHRRARDKHSGFCCEAGSLWQSSRDDNLFALALESFSWYILTWNQSIAWLVCGSWVSGYYTSQGGLKNTNSSELFNFVHLF